MVSLVPFGRILCVLLILVVISNLQRDAPKRLLVKYDQLDFATPICLEHLRSRMV